MSKGKSWQAQQSGRNTRSGQFIASFLTTWALSPTTCTRVKIRLQRSVRKANLNPIISHPSLIPWAITSPTLSLAWNLVPPKKTFASASSAGTKGITEFLTSAKLTNCNLARAGWFRLAFFMHQVHWSPTNHNGVLMFSQCTKAWSKVALFHGIFLPKTCPKKNITTSISSSINSIGMAISIQTLKIAIILNQSLWPTLNLKAMSIAGQFMAKSMAKSFSPPRN